MALLKLQDVGWQSMGFLWPAMMCFETVYVHSISWCGHCWSVVGQEHSSEMGQQEHST